MAGVYVPPAFRNVYEALSPLGSLQSPSQSKSRSITPSLTLDDLIAMPADSPARTPTRPQGQAMHLGYNFAEALSTKPSPSRSPARQKPRNVDRGASGAHTAAGQLAHGSEADSGDEDEAIADAVKTILEIITQAEDNVHTQPVQNVQGWAPADGSSFSLVDIVHAQAPLTLLRPSSHHHTRPVKARGLQSLEVDGGTRVMISASASSTVLARRSVQNVAGAQDAALAMSVSRSALTVLQSHNQSLTPRAPRPIAMSLPVATLAAFGRQSPVTAAASMASVGDRPTRRAPPPPRGVSPGRARSITHIRLARERAQQHVARAYAVRSLEGRPSVLTRWATPTPVSVPAVGVSSGPRRDGRGLSPRK